MHPACHRGGNQKTQTQAIRTNINKARKHPAGALRDDDRSGGQSATRESPETANNLIPLVPYKGRGRFPAHEEDCVCLPSGSVGSFLGKAMSTTDFWNIVNKQANKQTNKPCRCPGMRFRGGQLLITTGGVLWGGHQLASVQHKKYPAGPRQPPHMYFRHVTVQFLHRGPCPS